MDPQDVTPGAVEPRDDDQLVARRHAVEGRQQVRLQAKPRVRRAFAALLGRGGELRERRVDEPDRPQVRHATCQRLPSRSAKQPWYPRPSVEVGALTISPPARSARASSASTPSAVSTRLTMLKPWK